MAPAASVACPVVSAPAWEMAIDPAIDPAVDSAVESWADAAAPLAPPTVRPPAPFDCVTPSRFGIAVLVEEQGALVMAIVAQVRAQVAAQPAVVAMDEAFSGQAAPASALLRPLAPALLFPVRGVQRRAMLGARRGSRHQY